MVPQKSADVWSNKFCLFKDVITRFDYEVAVFFLSYELVKTRGEYILLFSKALGKNLTLVNKLFIWHLIHQIKL